MIVTTNTIKFNISNNKIRDMGTIILIISKILIITVKEMLTLDSKKIEIQIIQKNILTNIKLNIIQIFRINKINMTIVIMMKNTDKKIKIRHQKIPVVST